MPNCYYRATLLTVRGRPLVLPTLLYLGVAAVIIAICKQLIDNSPAAFEVRV